MSYGYEALLSIEDELEALPTYQDPEPVPSFRRCLFWNLLMLLGVLGLTGFVGWAIWRL